MTRRRAAVLLLSAVTVLGILPAASAQTGAVKVADAKRENNVLKFTVYTPGGPLLTSDDFEVTVNRLPATNLVAIGEAGVRNPAGAVLVLDTSGSMRGRPIEEAKRAARRFVNTVGISSKIALVGFSSAPRVIATFSDDHRAVLRALPGLEASGETALHDAVIRAASLVANRPPEQRNIVVLSDGGDTVSNSSMAEAIDAAQDAGATVFVVGLRSPEYSPATVRALPEQTGGRLLVTSDSAELSQLFKDLARTLVSRYEVIVTNPDPGATFLDVGVTVGGTKALSGSATFRFSSPEPEDTGIPSVSRLPLPVLLLIVFVGVALFFFLTSETVREAKNSPADRVIWYEQDGTERVNPDALINAAVLDRARDLATSLADRTGYLERMEVDIDAAGMKWRPGEVIVASALLAVAGGFLGFAVGGLPGLIFGGIIGLLGPYGYVKHNASRRRRAFTAQLSDVLMLLAGALRAGYSLQQAIAAVAEDAKPPASDEFRRAVAEVRLGASLDDALHELARRINVVDFEWTVLAIEIQREVGGDLAEILEIIADTIRERERLRRQIRTLTAEGRLSGWVLGILPFGMAGFLLMNNPDYLEPLFTQTTGLMMIGGSLFLMVIGVLWMRKIVKIEV